MCGINGFNSENKELILKMNHLIQYRGPDQTGCCVEQGVSLGQNRLSIIDLSENGRQPMWDRKRELVIVFNGEIYNFKEIKKILEKKYNFKSQSDTEVILYAYREYGAACVQKLNGIFAFAIWDTRTKQLFLARDRMGVKPLYYYFDGKRLIFSSEIKPLLVHPIKRQVDKEAFNLYFQLLYTPEPYTMFEGIKKLPAANYLIFKNNNVQIKRYWETINFSDVRNKNEAKAEIVHLFGEAVKGQLISDRPVGVFLSGGLDSTAVLAFARKCVGGKVETFSVGFKDSTDPEKFNADFLLARRSAQFFDTSHNELMIGPADALASLDKIIWHLDEPNPDPTAINSFLLSRLAVQKVAVVLGGDGGDELFGGYARYFYSYLLSLYQKFPVDLQMIGKKVLQILSLTKMLNKIEVPPSAKRILLFLGQKQVLLERALAPEVYQPFLAESYLSTMYFQNDSLKDFEKQFMNIDRQSWLTNESLMLTDRMTMASGLECRVPILDHRLVELANRIPTKWKMNLGRGFINSFQGKKIWCQALKPYLPSFILHQPKRGWFAPTAKWLRMDFSPIVSEVFSRERLNTEYFNFFEVQKIWHNHLNFKEYNLHIIWAIFIWQLWYEKFIKNGDKI